MLQKGIAISYHVNNRLQLRKKALMEKDSGAFVTITGEVDEQIGDLLLRKEQMNATRVCGGACSLPSQIGSGAKMPMLV